MAPGPWHPLNPWNPLKDQDSEIVTCWASEFLPEEDNHGTPPGDWWGYLLRLAIRLLLTME